jgi:hypothetical protein
MQNILKSFCREGKRAILFCCLLREKGGERCFLDTRTFLKRFRGEIALTRRFGLGDGAYPRVEQCYNQGKQRKSNKGEDKPGA